MKQIIPHLMVESVSDNIKYYKDILGFEASYIQKEGDIENFAIFKYGNVQVMAGQKDLFKDILPGIQDKILHNASLLYFELIDIDTYYETIKDKVEIIKELRNTWYNTREFWIKDCNGYLLGFFQNI